MEFKEKGLVGVGWIHLAQDRAQWRALLILVINLGFNKTMVFS
jgi:hypothetical protein